MGRAVASWAEGERTVEALVLIGSRQRPAGCSIDGADAHSDWDFHVIGSRPALFADANWTCGFPDLRPVVYAPRIAAIGGVPKVNAILVGGEVDLVVIPSRPLRLLRLLVAVGLHRRSAWVRSKAQSIAVVIRPGWTFLKGDRAWSAFYRKVADEVADPRLGDAQIRGIADTFACNYLWCRRKIERGELLAARRMIHRELAEANLQLFHEARLRCGLQSFPEGRRIERLVDSTQLASLSVEYGSDAPSISHALEHCASTLRALARELLGEAWRWPSI